jgi:hypothetical protein
VLLCSIEEARARLAAAGVSAVEVRLTGPPVELRPTGEARVVRQRWLGPGVVELVCAYRDYVS